ncbi:MAG: DUF1501 domain-containing protein [Ignavibacteria bacterium]|nr:DUF1501 domain-containing protein [Ignavibacteria bacterium]
MNKNTPTRLSRRSFIARTSGAVALPMLFNGIPLQAFDGPVVNDLFNVEAETDRVLVLVQLNGGNDGLNTVIPLSEYGTYQSLRSNIAITENKVLKLSNATGIHPVMKGAHELWSEQKMNVVQGVTYPNPNLSHFRSTDIWMSGSASNVNETTGWIGRYLNTEYPDYPTGYPNTKMPDPVAIQMAPVVGLALTGYQHQSMGIALQDPETFYKLVSGTDAPGNDLPSTKLAAENIKYVREVQMKSLQFSAVIKSAADKAQNKFTYPTSNRLADQLKIVARLVAGGLKTRVYVVQLGGFDTHASQVGADDTITGTHANLLQMVSEAITAFQRDIEALGIADRVVTMTFSEFGRRVASNQSLGTDHGTAAPMMFFGVPVQDGIIGTNPDMKNLDNGNLKMQYDFRQIYASVLEQWFGAKKAAIKDILFGSFSTVKVIKSGTTSVDSEESVQQGSAWTFQPISPNPVQSNAIIRYELRAAHHVRLEIFDNLGFHVATIVHEAQESGLYEHVFEVAALPSGTYMVQLTLNDERAHQAMIVAK